eukprot:765891-Hanusia_phi.AAC.2
MSCLAQVAISPHLQADASVKELCNKCVWAHMDEARKYGFVLHNIATNNIGGRDTDALAAADSADVATCLKARHRSSLDHDLERQDEP